MSDSSAFEMVCALQAEGQYLAAHDHAVAALAAGSEHDGLRHRAVLALAQSGASGSALRLFERLGMNASQAPEIVALGARLLKDQALMGAAGAARAAETSYGRLWRRSGEAWHGTNAAAMALLAGAPARARARVEALGELRDDGDYWAAATLAEAAMLRSDTEACANWLAIAEARAGSDLNARRTTRRQLRWIAQALDQDFSIVDALRIPSSVHFCGNIPRGPDRNNLAPETTLRAQLGPALHDVGFGFGSLAAGADIVIAEALLDQGAELTLVLPVPPDEFAARSVLPAGEAWLPRFRTCLAQARVIVLEASLHDDLDYAMVSRRAMGLARLHAGRVDGAVWQVAVPNRTSGSPGPAGTAADMKVWAASDGRTCRVESPWQAGTPGAARDVDRVLHAVLFGDLPGFGRLDDRALAAFYEGPLRAIGPLTERAAYRNSWGDAIKLVFSQAADAAHCALAIQRILTTDAFKAWGLPETLIPRMAIDFGPLQPVQDAVQGVPKFAGRVMTRAARIEPVTPPGLVYATEALACEIALQPGVTLACDYAGLVQTAKGFGMLPLYAVRER